MQHAQVPASATLETGPERPLVIKAEEVARLLGYKTDASFRNKRLLLEEEGGFPRKLPGINGWSRPAVERWIETNGGTYLPADLVEEDAP